QPSSLEISTGSPREPSAGQGSGLAAPVTILWSRKRCSGGDAVADRARFRGTIRSFRPERAGGLAVVDIPGDAASVRGCLTPLRVRGALNGQELTSNTMPA